MISSVLYLYQNIDDKTRRRLWMFMIVSFISPVLNLFGISAILPILNNIMNGMAGKKDVLLAFAMAVLMVISGLFDLYCNRLSGRLSYEGAHNMSLKIFDLTLKENLLEHNERDAMQALALVRTDTMKCLEYLRSFVSAAVSTIILIIFFGFLAYLDGFVGVLLSVFVSIEMVLMYLKNRKRMKLFGEKIREADIQTNGQVTTAYGAYKELKTDGNPIKFIRKYENKSLESAELKIDYSNKNAVVGVVMKNCIYTVMFLVLALVMLLNVDMTTYISKTVVTVMVIIRVLPMGNKAVACVNVMKGAEKSYEYVRDALTNYYEITNQEREKKAVRTKKLTFEKGIFIRDLCFAYPNGKVIFDHADMDIPVGSSVAIIGPSGTGKTTFLDVLLGLMRPQSGSIYFDDYDSVQQRDEEGECVANIGSIVSYIPQVVFMNGSTVKENVAFFEKEAAVDEEKVKQCLKAACILEDVMAMPDGLNTLIGAQGIAISGGQRQRIALARALYKDFELLIMDEATAALDSDTEKAVMDSINQLRGKKTLLMVTHHDFVSEQCDIVYRVKEGKIMREK